MSRMTWDNEGERYYETGVKDVALYLKKNKTTSGNLPYAGGVPWNGVTAVNENPSGAEANPLYADDIKYLNLISNEEFGASIEAYQSPEEFDECDGSAELAEGVTIGQQGRETFGLCYKTTIGNDVDGINKGYKLNIIYGGVAAPSEKAHATINESPEAMTMSWEISTTPVPVTGKKPTAKLTINTTKLTSGGAAKLKLLEAILYGADEFSSSKTYALGDVVAHTVSETTKLYKCKTAVTTPAAWSESNWDEITGTESGPRLPLPDEIATMFAAG